MVSRMEGFINGLMVTVLFLVIVIFAALITYFTCEGLRKRFKLIYTLIPLSVLIIGGLIGMLCS